MKYAQGVKALDGVNLSIGSDLVGLLGPNGAGKTTLLSVLSRRLRLQGGTGSLLGVPLEDPSTRTEWLQHVSYLSQEETPPHHLTGREVVQTALDLARPSWPRKRKAEAVEQSLRRVNLENAAGRRAITYSGGMRRRLGLARAIAPEPRLLLIDEPTSGLDPQERVSFRDLLCRVADVSAVVVSTHIAADVEVSCNRVVVFVRGRVLWEGTPQEMIRRAMGRVRSTAIRESEIEGAGDRYKITSMVREGDFFNIRFIPGEGAEASGEAVVPTLEEAYIDMVAGNGGGGADG